MLKGTKLYSILKAKCPVCQEDDLYVHKNPYRLGSLLKMHERCRNCHTKYAMEPSFFYGAMYVSYTLGVGIGVALFIFAYLILKLNVLQSFLLISGGIILMLPLIIRLSRNVWLNLFFKFDRKKSRNA